MVQLIAGKKGGAITQMGEFAATGENGDEKNRGRKRMQGYRGLTEPGQHPGQQLVKPAGSSIGKK
jgi:hypothetical protein